LSNHLRDGGVKKLKIVKKQTPLFSARGEKERLEYKIVRRDQF